MTRCDWTDDCEDDAEHPVSISGYTFVVCSNHGPKAWESQQRTAELADDLDRIAEQTRTGRRR